MARARSLLAPCRPGSTLNTAEPWSSSRGSGSMRWMRSAGQDRPNCSTTARLRSSSLTISAMRPSSKPNAPLLQHPTSSSDGEGNMRAALQIRDDLSPDQLRGLARRERNGRAAARMYAIAHALEGMSRAEAARLAGMERQALRDAVVRYNAEGPCGLQDRPKGHAPQRLTEGEQATLMAVI